MVVSKTYNSSIIEQLGVCTIKLIHKDKAARCRYFVGLRDSPVILGADIEALGILKITCEVVKYQQMGRKSDSRQHNQLAP